MKQESKQAIIVKSLVGLMSVITIVTIFGVVIWRQTAQQQEKEERMAQAVAEYQLQQESDIPQTKSIPEPREASFAVELPQDLRAAQIEPGREFLTELAAPLEERARFLETGFGEESPEAPYISDVKKAKEEIKQVVEDAKEKGLNALFVRLNNLCGILGSENAPIGDFDVLGILSNLTQKENIQLYGIYDLSLEQDESGKMNFRAAVDAASLDKTANQLTMLAQSGKLDGILLDGYSNPETSASYAQLVKSGENRDMDRYLTEGTSLMVKNAVDAIHEAQIPAGLAVDAVWATDETRPEGIAVSNVEETSLDSYHADTRAMVEQGLADFVVVKNYSSIENEDLPFETVAEWWDDCLANTSTPAYMGCASSNAEKWNSEYELADQWEISRETDTFSGSVYDSLQALDAQSLPMQELTQVWKEDGLLSETSASKEEKSAGIYSEQQDFYANQILMDMDPVGVRSVADGDTVLIRAVALPGSNVTALINGERVVLSETGKRSGMTGYSRYEAEYEIKESKVNSAMGNVEVSAEKNGVRETLTGARLDFKSDRPLQWQNDNTAQSQQPQYQQPQQTSSNQNTGIQSYKQPTLSVSDRKITNGTLVQVVAEQALTFPTYKNTIYPDVKCYPIPYGTLDTVVGDKVSINDGQKYRYYYNLASGRRVYCDDVKAVSGISSIKNNTIHNMTVKATSDFTYVILQSDYPVSYLPEYLNGKMRFHFQNTTRTPSNMQLTKNPIFSAATWNGSTLELSFLDNGFLGYKGYNENGNIVLRFNNPTTIKGARITVDPGHGGKDPGVADNIDPEWPEKRVNWELAQAIAKELQARGADVNLLQTYNKTTSLDSRLEQAKNADSSLFLCMHTNASEASTAAHGSECYYFYPFAQNLANQMAKATSGALSTQNRGTKYDVFYVTRDPQMVGILSEVGFLSNPTEYNKLKSSKYHQKVGEYVADAVEEFLKNAGSRYIGRSGIESTGPDLNASNGPYSLGGNGVQPHYPTTPPQEEEQEQNTNPDSQQNQEQNQQPETQPQQPDVPSHKPVPETVYSSGKTTGDVKYIIFTNPQNKKLDLNVGDSQQLGVRISGDQEVRKKYITSNKYVAVIDKNGVITATGPGSCKITVVAGNQGGSINVKVRGSGYYLPPTSSAEQETETQVPPQNQPQTPQTPSMPQTPPAPSREPVSETTYSQGSISDKVKYIIISEPENQQMKLEVGKSQKLNIKTVGDDSAQKKYTTSNKYVAVINSDGVITATGPGSCKIRIVAGNQGATISVNVTGSGTYTPPSSDSSGQGGSSETVYSAGNTKGTVNYIMFTEPKDKVLNLKAGQTSQLGVYISGDQTVQKKYTTSNRNVAVINSDGVITATGAGSCKIRVVAGNQGGSITVNVTP